MGLSVHFWIVFQSVLFREKFQLILYYRIFTKNFAVTISFISEFIRYTLLLLVSV